MKNALFVFVPALVLMQASTLNCSAQQAALPPAIVRTVSAIKDEARAAQHNASLYQWQRVNREVDRIVSETHKLPTILPASAKLDTVQKDVQDLRAARLRHNVTDIVDATTRLIADCNTLLNL